MPISTNFELIYEFDSQKTGRASAPGVYSDWPVRIVIKKNFVSGSEETCAFVPEHYGSYAPNDLLLVDLQGQLQHVGHIA